MDGIDSIARQGIAMIENDDLRRALDAVYQLPETVKTVQVAHRVFERLTSSSWDAEKLCFFLSGWQSTHGTSLFVSGLIIRLLREAERAAGPSSLLLYRAAGMIGEVIPEDTGVDDIPHSELFARFATYIVGDDRWRLDRYTNPACERFRVYVKEQRLAGPIQEAILTTAASENWNSGGYTYMESIVRSWMVESLGHSAEDIQEKAAYVTAHAGQTELGHFLHVMGAWELYCHATGSRPKPMLARQVFERYLTAVGSAFLELETHFPA